MEHRYRINTNIGQDQVLNINLKQDVDIYEMLSLTLRQENLYKLHSADYGVIVGRVLANDAFGVPNAKVTVFIPLSDEDKLNQDIRAIYPYVNVTDTDSRNVKYNTLPNYKKFACHQEVGSFPQKRLLLDDDLVLEIYDKYYKYTTVTNNAGDYMIFGVPTGEQILHVDVDLSDIGVLSQEPRDFIYKGYSMDLFESPTQFKKGTNLDDLPQIQNQSTTVTVYPLWGDRSANEIAITRKDINLQYKFEPTCVFIGSVITDNGSNSISHNCVPDKYVGDAGQLTTSKGNIEMIRKTIDDKIEEYPIKGNQLIDGDGVWCYQIPMNLDYVGMDEYGNIVATDNPNKGIPTRSRVRFRFSLDESGDDSLTRHKARYLVPNNPDLNEESVAPMVEKDILDSDRYYEFGTLTPDECFRDLYWNKVYSIKSYVPRIQGSRFEKTENYLAIKGVNKHNAMGKNPLPFNKLNLNFSIPAYYIVNAAGDYREIRRGWSFLKSYSIPYNIDAIRDEVIDETDALGLDFYNDWLNGCLYFPQWFWRIRQKKKYKNGEAAYDSDFCECKREDNTQKDKRLYLYNNCSLVYKNNDMVIALNVPPMPSTYNMYDSGSEDEEGYSGMYTSVSLGSKNFYSGIIKKMTNKDGAEIYYYTFGNKLGYNTPLDAKESNGKTYYKYARLFSTDIILLGSLKETDIDGVPQVLHSIPSTTSNIPPVGRYKRDPDTDDEDIPQYDEDQMEENKLSYNGMNWGEHWYDGDYSTDMVGYKYMYGSGLFFGLNYERIYHGWGPTKHLHAEVMKPIGNIKTGANAERICELGVTFDSEYQIPVLSDNGNDVINDEMDGLITKHELQDVDTRSWFATLNHNKLIGVKENSTTGYKTYNLTYMYPTNFDGRLGDKILTVTGSEERVSVTELYTSGATTDFRNKDYLDFRLGSTEQKFISTTDRFKGKRGLDDTNGEPVTGGRFGHNRTRGSVNEATDDDTSYNTQDGSVTYTKYFSKRIRHFYGYDKDVDRIPAPSVITGTQNHSNGFTYTFPLYDNSFYFFFGLNQGSTAIDKFYEMFFSKCPSEETSPFIVDVVFTAATECESTTGRMNVNVQGANMPYSIELINNGNVVTVRNNINVYNSEFTGLSNGSYTINITDSYGIGMSEEVEMQYPKINLVYSTSGITNNTKGMLKIEGYTLYESDLLNVVSRLEGSNGIYDIGNSNYNVTLEVSLASAIDSVVANKIYISSPTTLNLQVYETCNGKKSGNIAYYTVSIGNEPVYTDEPTPPNEGNVENNGESTNTNTPTINGDELSGDGPTNPPSNENNDELNG